MIKKPLTYEDLDGNMITEDFYFHMTRAELANMLMTTDEGFEEWIKRIMASEKGSVIYPEVTKIVLSTYGVRADNGKRFIKSPELTAEFEQSDAFGALIMELMKGEAEMAAFIRGVMPESLQRQVQEREVQEAKADGASNAEVAKRLGVEPSDVRELHLPPAPSPQIIEVEQPGPATDEQQPAWIRENRDPTPAEVRSMSKEELQAVTLRKLLGPQNAQ